MNLELEAGDFERLERLRAAFLAGRGRSPWRDERDLVLYDATFGRRIAWKWDAVLDELAARGIELPTGRVLDFGCGTGVAARAWLARPIGSGTRALWLHDTSALAREHARARIASEHPALRVELGLPAEAPALLLASHVIGELAPMELETFVALARTAQAVVWIEPGAHAVSRTLSGVRDQLLDSFDVLAPCTHAERCPMLAPEHEKDWCHAFARPPREVFTDSDWAKLGQRLGIDLRSVPYAFLVLRRKDPSRTAAPAADLDRFLGRPRIEKGRVLVDACGKDGLRALRLLERDDRPAFERLAEPAGESLLYELQVENGRIRSARRAT